MHPHGVIILYSTVVSLSYILYIFTHPGLHNHSNWYIVHTPLFLITDDLDERLDISKAIKGTYGNIQSFAYSLYVYMTVYDNQIHVYVLANCINFEYM